MEHVEKVAHKSNAPRRLFSLLAAGAGGLLVTACPITGQPNTWTESGNQFEGVINIATFPQNNTFVAVVMFNDHSDQYSDSNKVQYTETTRTIFSGASLFGWSFVNTNEPWYQNQWVASHEIVPASSPFGIYWGDSGIAMQPNDPHIVYMTQLALHKDLIPPQGIQGTFEGSGAVVFRSNVSGETFLNSTEAALTNNRHFYDGSSLAADNTGAFYAAYLDVTTAKIDVWRSASYTSPFSLLPNSGIVSATSHPRLMVNPANNDLYLMTQSGSDLKIARRVAGVWQAPVTAATGVISNSSIAMGTTAGLPGKLRFGPQYSFDVAGSELRFVYTKPVGALLRVFGGKCTTSGSAISGCSTVTAWSPHLNSGAADSPGDQLMPLIAFGAGKWIASWTSRETAPSDNKVSIWHGELIGGATPSMTKTLWTDNLVVCSDLRGLWGDYDQLKFAGVDPSSGVRIFLRPYSDSGGNCSFRWQFTSKAVHMSLGTFQY